MSDTALLPIRIVALYHFTPFEDIASLRAPLQKLCDREDIKGILLLAPEGINGTIAGSDEGMERVLEHIRTLPGCENFEYKEARAPEVPFRRMKVRLKREIVTMGQPNIDPRKNVGQYVDPKDWNALISDPETIVIDTRNDYEVAIGTFKRAEDPKTRSFGEFPEWFRKRRKEIEAQGKTPKIAMFCTGGIRCEKSTAFAKSEGVEEVYHLKGGILKYLETIPEEESLWEGECFVFDQRVSVKHGLEIGKYDVCHACRRPISEKDKASSLFVQGVSCPHCHNERTEKQRSRYEQRERQEALAAERGVPHLGERQK
ncbi:oxygen-dependent tRNA uridine(34) hydroxylase TrhO [Swingsia samuiensis]|nr:rhodanese-related sulfurtransferase [Swingsia samuiensis]